MMKKLLLGGMVSAAILVQGFAAEPAKQPQLTPEQQAQLMQMLQQQQAKAITVDEAFKALPENLASYNGKVFTKKELLALVAKQIPGGKLPPGVSAEMVQQMAPRMISDMVSQQLLLDAARKAGIVVVNCDKRKLDFMSVTKAHQGVIAVAAVGLLALVIEVNRMILRRRTEKQDD